MTTAVKEEETEILSIKKCNRCLLEKPLAEFARDSSKRNGIRGQCRTCRSELDSLRKGRTPKKSSVPVVPKISPEALKKQTSKAEAHRQAILRLIDRHRSEFDSLVYSEQVRLGVISVNDSPRERWVSLI